MKGVIELDTNKGNRIINILLCVDLLILVITALINEIIPKEIFGTVHVIPGFLLVVLVLFHLRLNRKSLKKSNESSDTYPSK
jgi:Kef-type K+ transport system membrane component KefB